MRITAPFDKRRPPNPVAALFFSRSAIASTHSNIPLVSIYDVVDVIGVPDHTNLCFARRVIFAAGIDADHTVYWAISHRSKVVAAPHNMVISAPQNYGEPDIPGREAVSIR